MTAVETAVRPTNAAVRIAKYFTMLVLVVMTRPPKFVVPRLAREAFPAFAVIAAKKVSSARRFVSPNSSARNNRLRFGFPNRRRIRLFRRFVRTEPACRQRSKSAGFPRRKASTPRLRRGPISSASCSFRQARGTSRRSARPHLRSVRAARRRSWRSPSTRTTHCSGLSPRRFAPISSSCTDARRRSASRQCRR